MDKLILGLLMVKRLTVYEIRGLISANFKAMCSDSLGSIQAALKRLLSMGMVTYTEGVEKGVNKKRYAITDAGRAELKAWINTPAAISNPRNIELGKLLFMGLVPRGNRKRLIDGAIEMLEQELGYLMEIKKGVESMDIEAIMGRITIALENDRAYYDGVVLTTENGDMRQNLKDIDYYEQKVLEYGIEMTKFQIKLLTDLGGTHDE